MKKKILYIAAIVLCLSIMTGGTLAFYTKTDTARNIITTDGVSVELVQQQLKNGALAPSSNDPIPVMPTSVVSKIVSVKNLEQDVWTRLRYDITVYDATGKQMDIPTEELEQVILFDTDLENWTKSEDGWWYYNVALAAGETTAPLFTTVSFSGPNMDNKYQGSKAVIHVTAQAVQKANNGETMADALGWPET